MIIQRKRIRNLERHLPDNLRGQELRLGIVTEERYSAQIIRAGFSGHLSLGDRMLPAIIGPVTRFNAEGKMNVRRDLPMETAYRLVEWHWTERHGKEEVERSDFRDVPYQRYPRDFVPPPGVELQVIADAHGRLLLVADPLLYEGAGSVDLLHAVNVCLELFGECEVFTPDLASALPPTACRLNWQILPPGNIHGKECEAPCSPLLTGQRRGIKGP